MIWKVICIILTVCIIGFIINTVECCRKKRKAVSFKDTIAKAEVPVISFENNDKMFNFIIDTGSNCSYINTSNADDFLVSETGMGSTYMGIDGIEHTVPHYKAVLKLGNKEFVEEFGAADLSTSFDKIKEEDGIEVHGILGSNFFARYHCVIDFKNSIFYI